MNKMNKMNEEIVREVKANVKELNYKGFESGTFFDQNSEFHNDAYEEVLYSSIDNLIEAIEDEAHFWLRDSDYGNLAFEIILENIEKKVSDLVEDCIEELYF